MPKILIVDDDRLMRVLLKASLEGFEDKGVEILLAKNGKEALDIILFEKPQLVYLDIMMPEMSGYEVCYEVKHNLKMENVFITLLTAKGQELDKKKGFEVGADLYITKPFDPDFIVENTEKILGIQL